MTTSSPTGRTAAGRPRVRRAPRNTLNRERVLDAAVALLDSAGPQAFTMRALAERLGVATMAVYSYFSSKDEIVDAVRVRLLAEAELPSRREAGADGRGARDELRELCRAAYRLLADHPSVLYLMAARPPDGDEFTLFAERTLEVLLRAGLGRPQAARAYTALTQFTVGAALWAARSERSPGRSDGSCLPPDRYPHLTATARELTRAAREGTPQYERGLDALLSGLLGPG